MALVLLLLLVGGARALMPWQDWTLPLDDRVADLVGRLTFKELIDQTGSVAPAIPRFNITAYNWRSNCLHGWSASGGDWLPNETWSVLPTSLGMGSTWDRTMVRAAGRVTADEGRALHNLGEAASAQCRGGEWRRAPLARLGGVRCTTGRAATRPRRRARPAACRAAAL